jgi:hypothetical protein
LADQYTTNDDADYTFTIIGTPPTAAGCSPTTTNLGNYSSGIDRVQFNTLDHAHTDNDNDGLQDFSCLYNTTVSTNTGYTLTVTTQDAEYCIAYIDYDDDGDFEAGELVLDHRNTNSGTSHSVTVNIPQYPAVTGKLIRMRIKSNFNTMTSDICVDSDYGEFEDYSVYITPPACVAPTINTHPSNLASCDPATGTFSCTATGPSMSYQWQVNNGGGFANVSNGGIYSGATTATLGVTGATTAQNDYIYRCYVTTACGNATTNTATLNALTAPTASCTPSLVNTGNYNTGIYRVQFNTIDNVHTASNNDGVQNFTCSKSTTVTAGSTYAFIITGGSQAEYARIYIDYNDDGDFADAGESVYTNNSTRLSSHTGNITIPTSSVVTGKLIRMRVITDYNTMSSGCPASITYGEVEDYGIYVPCIPPTVTGTTPASGCGVGTVNLAATASAGTIKWYDASSGGTLLHTGTSFTTPSLSSSTTYYAEAVHVTCVSAARTAVTATVTIPSQVQASQRGTTLATLGTAIIADAVAGATSYRFEVTENGNTEVITRSSRWMYLSNLSDHDYGKTYAIRVSVQVGGVYSCYGTSYNVSSPALPTTSIQSSQCGATLPTLFTAIQATAFTGATGYKFEVTSTHGTQVITTANSYFYLNQLSTYTYGTSYTVRVAFEYNGTYGSYGSSCVVKSPSVTTLQASQCNNSVMPTASTAIVANEVSGATSYKFEVTIDGVAQIVTRTVRWFYLSNLSSYGMNKQLKVRVSVQKDGVWGPYYTSCYIKTPVAWLATDETIHAADGDLMGDISVEAYPNPNSGDFTVSSTHEGTFTVLNELGQVMKRVEFTTENNKQVRIEGLKHGVYFITGTINNEVITKKVIVSN